MKTMLVTDEARKAVWFGRENHWRFRVVGISEPLESPRYLDGWWYEPVAIDSIESSEGRKRVAALKSAGFDIRQVIVAHEAPKLLCAPKVEPKPIRVNIPWKTIAKTVTTVFTAVLYATGLLVGLAFSVLVDPAVLVVLKDGSMVEVVWYYE